MSLICSPLVLISVLLFQSELSLPVNAHCERQEQEVMACHAEFEAYQTDSLLALQEIFYKYQVCSTSLEETKAELKRSERNFRRLTAALLVPSSQTRAARVPQPKVSARVNMSATFSCQSNDGQAWTLCIWERNLQGNTKLVVLDQEGARNGGTVDGIAHVGDMQNDDGNCQINIEPVTAQHFGKWSCTLVSQNGLISRGELFLGEVSTML